MRRAPGGAIHRLLTASCALLLGAGCAWLPDDLLAELFGEREVERETPPPELPPPLEDCALMTVLMDASPHSDPEIAGRARLVMSREFEHFGARITDSPDDAYWSLMLLAIQNSRRDGFILNALLTARTGSESHGPGMTVFSKDGAVEVESETDGEEEPAGAESDEAVHAKREAGVATLYNGIAYGPHALLAKQARALTRQASYAAVYPAARRMCDYAADELQRERDLEGQVPAGPEPL